MRLQDKVAIVTGAGSGIGQASAIRFAGRCQTGSGRQKAGETGRDSRDYQEIGGEDSVPTDVGIDRQVAEMVSQALELFHKIDILFNCAGVGYCSPYVMWSTVETPPEDWDEILNINLRSVFYTTRHVLPIMKEQGSGAILNCSSINGVIGCGADAYSASKGGIIAYSRALAVDNAKYHIRVNTVSPAATDTPMIQGAYDRIEGFYEYWSNAAPQENGRGERCCQCGAVPDEASYITGQNLMVDGGGLSIS